MKRTKKPMTWGCFAKFCGIGTLISAVVTGVFLVHAIWREISGFFTNKFNKLIHKD